MSRCSISFLAAGLLMSSIPFLHAKGLVVNHEALGFKDGEAIPRPFLDQARKLKVFFGHQSVGGNIMEGLQQLASSRPERFLCKIESVADAEWFVKNEGIGEGAVGENGSCHSKVKDFVKIMNQGMGDKIDVAMMKFCYVDFNNESDVDKEFRGYCEGMEKVEKGHPKLKVVWWTVPLVSASENESNENAVRNRFNQKVREFCVKNGKILFDLADLEAHDGVGKEFINRGGQALLAAYSSDGGHLNEMGARRVALAWWFLMARISGWNGLATR